MNNELLTLLLSGIVLATKRVSAPHPPWWGRLIRRFLAVGFPIAQHLLFDLQVDGLANFTNSPGTLIVANHKTDFDIVHLGPTIYWSHRGHGPGGRIAFVAAERMFLPGYLSDYILHRPQWLRHLIYPANLSAVLKAIRAYPIGYLRVRKLKAHLRTVLETEGDLPLSEVLALPVEEVIPSAAPTMPISRVLRFRYSRALDQEWGFSVLAPAIRKKLRARHVQEIIAALARFAAVLDAGDSLYLAPEGGLETDGKFEEAKAGLIRLVELARDPIILPVNLTYDFMTTGKVRTFLTIGKELRGVKEWSRQHLEQEIINTISRLGTVTFSQLAAAGMRKLTAADEIVHANELKQAIIHRALHLYHAGYRVDTRILAPNEFARRWRRFIAYCTRHKLIERTGPWIIGDHDKLFGDAADGRTSPWVYAANELETITSATEVSAEAV